nr:MAG TPA: hypothetical protein [Bacteriophage sp.]
METAFQNQAEKVGCIVGYINRKAPKNLRF